MAQYRPLMHGALAPPLSCVVLALLVACLILAPLALRADERFSAPRTGLYWDWGPSGWACDGDCAVTIFGGPQNTTDTSTIFGITGLGTGNVRFDPSKIKPFWEWDWTDDVLAGGTFSRRIATFGYGPWGDILALDAELGIAQRFGAQDETEIWGAVFFRWMLFPWNDYVYTTTAISTGLNYATGISDYEKSVSGNGEGSRLLHYMSLEFTFAWPDRKDRELVFRLHHRSGGRNVIGHIDMFNGVTGGAEYLVVGTRWRF